MGFKKQEIPITANAPKQTLDIHLVPLSMQMKEVIIKNGGEDPAYAIIRQAIKKRSYYQSQVDAYTCDSYLKNLMKLRGAPKKFFGQKIDKDDLGVDSTGKGIVFLSESVTKISYQKPGKMKLDVISDRVSGGDGYGVSFPAFINFYDNNVEAIISQINPRGFISPISENALLYYKYHYEGSFQEDGKTVNKIQVIPRRKQEPVFSGTIFITDDDWRIHSTDLLLTKEYQLELIDTLRIRQTHIPVEKNVWRTKDQVLYFTMKPFGFNIVGTSVNVYSNYNLHPNFPKKYFDKVIMKYDTASQKRSVAYWDTIRPVPLEKDEAKDFVVKDSTAKAFRDSMKLSRNIDSLRKKQKPVSVMNVLWSGVTRRDYYMRESDSSLVTNYYTMRGLVKSLQYNTVEGLVPRIQTNFTWPVKRGQSLSLATEWRYGLSNGHFNANGYLTYIQRNDQRYQNAYNQWTLGGGKRVNQFNKANPISPLMNALYTLLLKENYMKIYENYFGMLAFERRWSSSLRIGANLTYEDRIPLENTTDFVIFKNDKKSFTPNHPEDLANIPFVRSQAVMFGLRASYQPGQRFIEYPTGRVSMGSKYPTFEANYTKGIPDILGSDVDYDKWQFSVHDDMNFKLLGTMKYRLTTGGFINSNAVTIPDLQHFNGNQVFYNTRYVNSFQMAPYYKYSNAASWYGMVNMEHHFNGLLTNKIPLFNRLKWNLVAGTNIFYVNKDNQYYEVFAGLENIFKVIRVDVVGGYQSSSPTRVGVRVGFGGILGGALNIE